MNLHNIEKHLLEDHSTDPVFMTLPLTKRECIALAALMDTMFDLAPKIAQIPLYKNIIRKLIPEELNEAVKDGISEAKNAS